MGYLGFFFFIGLAGVNVSISTISACTGSAMTPFERASVAITPAETLIRAMDLIRFIFLPLLLFRPNIELGPRLADSLSTNGGKKGLNGRVHRSTGGGDWLAK